MTTDETVDCYNCGRSNPEWAQVCRSCGVPLRHGQARVVPTGRIPTDTNSLISIAAVIGVILGAVVLGIFLSSLNPTDPIVGEGAPTPTATPSPSARTHRSATERHAKPTPSPTPALPGTIAFGSQLDANRPVTTPVETFTPPMAFAYSVTMPNGFGVSVIENEIAKVDDDGETIVLPRSPSPLIPRRRRSATSSAPPATSSASAGPASSSGACTSTEPSPRAAASATPRAS